ncbi:hypothetical protein COS61_02140 [Candidatus Wolfebacteria bacterium CG03_land_8_20_14_0_80_40_12]|uniref:Glycosidase n=3 Tax=Parcubacteria group TaxID=1794811 RepID=A0A2M7B5A9_9BACT|nr:MAG: hypothetical protein COS61_02140 [Candidatus Wolfebacteria bacterium CG03_land_8_20_14_0_80_40_12]
MLIERSDKNPILKPERNHSWEAEAVFNGCPVKKGGNVYLIYRALSLPHYHTLAQTKLVVSDIGIAESKDGIEFHNRKRFITPEESWERFGCEDPRVTKLGGKYYIFYTALSTFPFRAEGIRVGVAISKDLKTIQEKHLATPFNAKGMALFPEKINGKIWAVLTVHTDVPPSKICLASFNQESDMWSEEYWNTWYQNFSAEGAAPAGGQGSPPKADAPREHAVGGEKYSLPLQRRPEDQIEVGAPPLKTKDGWLLIYSYIQNYFSPKPLFGIEAVLLDLKNPLKVIAMTKAPLLTPEEYYERIGLVPNVIFPSGALLGKNSIRLYYGAADTTCCLATIDTKSLLAKLLKSGKQVLLARAKENPIIIPNLAHSWESKATYNPGAIYLDGKVHLIYRAMSEDNTSVLGYTTSQDGIHIGYHAPKPVYLPREPFEQKLVPGGNSGCEDPRLTKIGSKIYMFYTAFDGKNPPRIALTWILAKDFAKQKWDWAKPVLISPPDISDKDACVFPEKINGQYFIIHRIADSIDSALSPTLNFDGQTWIEEYDWIFPRAGMWDSKKVGAAAAPIKTKKGWVLFYHGVSEEDRFYRVGAILLDLKDPTKIIARSDKPIFEPETDYEKKGQMPNVVFPCGAVLLNDKFFLYYGGADKVVGVATIGKDELLKNLESCRC